MLAETVLEIWEDSFGTGKSRRGDSAVALI
jgi:hypothetical protein